MSENVNHPKHYNSDPSIECIEIVRHRNFNVGNAIKYLWRAGLKNDASMDLREKTIEDLEKAMFYINDEIERLEAESAKKTKYITWKSIKNKKQKNLVIDIPCASIRYQ